MTTRAFAFDTGALVSRHERWLLLGDEPLMTSRGDILAAIERRRYALTQRVGKLWQAILLAEIEQLESLLSTGEVA